MGQVSTWMGDRLSSRTGMEYINVRKFGFCPQIFINFSALLMSLMALQLMHVD